MVRDGICGESANGLKNGCRRWSVWVGQAGRSENCRRNFKLILCCFWSLISPHTKFRPNPIKNAVVENFYKWTGLVGQAGRSKNGYRHFYVVFGPLLAPIPNFIQIGWKTQKLKIFTIGRFWLVGLVGRKMIVGISNSSYVVFVP